MGPDGNRQPTTKKSAQTWLFISSAVATLFVLTLCLGILILQSQSAGRPAPWNVVFLLSSIFIAPVFASSFLYIAARYKASRVMSILYIVAACIVVLGSALSQVIRGDS